MLDFFQQRCHGHMLLLHVRALRCRILSSGSWWAGFGSAQPATVLPHLGRAAGWVCTHQRAALEHQFGSSEAAIACCPGCVTPCIGNLLLFPKTWALAPHCPRHIPSGHSICALNAKKAPVGSVPKPTLPPPRPAYLLPQRTSKPWGPSQQCSSLPTGSKVTQ